MFKIVITGPESTAKSSLCEQLSYHFDFPMVEEQSRNYLEPRNGQYSFEDLLHIAIQQIEAEERIEAMSKSKVLFCDTDLISIKIWSEFKYGKVDPIILRNISKRAYQLYLVCKPDIPWEPDPLRENPMDREILFQKHLAELEYYGKAFELIEGLGQNRFEMAKEHVIKYLEESKIM